MSDVDWTTDEYGRSNSSEAFTRLVAEVTTLILNDAYFLVRGDAEHTARVILAQLAHKYGMKPK